jgi:superfamily II DNA or RNA helicase
LGGGRHRAAEPDDAALDTEAVSPPGPGPVGHHDPSTPASANRPELKARHTRLEDLTRGARVRGVTGASAEVAVIDVQWIGTNAVTVTYRDDSGTLGDAILYRDHEPGLTVTTAQRAASFDGDPNDFKLALEAKRIRMAARFDPMLAVATSDVEPLPHQLKAVYGELLPRTPLRYLLADDPGAGKTIMAGLYIKELILRGDLERCLIVVPGGLTEQWQAELHEKFGLNFEILSRDMVEQTPDHEPFDRHRLLIAKMDQLARAEDLQQAIERAQWDLVIVDEAHRMSAHYQGQERKYTKRYLLGQHLGSITRHLLLMTATPHAGKEEDFQLFLALLDADRFEGRYRDGVHSIDAGDMMRRMVKEELLTFEGKPLFPERRAYTVPYRLSESEQQLYELVTQYVREEMNRADRLKDEGEGRRGNTVGFALTVLQRRLASSPEAIWRSLQRRRKRLERTRARLANQGTEQFDLATRLQQALGVDVPTDDALDELSAEEQEQLEEDVVDAATAAKTVAELDIEIGQLAQLEELARRLRQSGTDTKWVELRELLTKNETVRDASGNPRKIIIFTEHRDTLNYLVERIRTLLGSDEAVIAIHGGVKREERSKAQELFSQDKDTTVLVATDAAGEGLNLQRAHLMVNYDLPWNPNRLEQRFGRIHRIGQTEVCHLWNLVAAETREGAVFERLLDKIEQMRIAYAGKVFDVLGSASTAFVGMPLRDLLVRAIRYGDQPEIRAQLDTIIDANVAEGIEQLLAERALNRQVLDSADVTQMRLAMEEARARRLQPHYIKAFFDKALTELGGRVAERESGRFEVTHVPQLVRDRDRQMGTGAPVLRRYERITFDRELIRVPGRPQAELMAPGHPLLDALIDVTIERRGTALKHGTVLVDPTITEPRLLAAVTSSLVDGRGRRVSQRFDFVTVDPDGTTRAAGPAPYLDYDPPTGAQLDTASAVTSQPWVARAANERALAWAVEHGARQHLQQVRALTAAQAERTEKLVSERLRTEINHWDMRSLDLADKEAQGKSAKMSAEYAGRRARDLERRLERRLQEIAGDAAITARPPEVAALALVLPPPATGDGVPVHARDTEEVDRRAIAAVLAAERTLGRTPTEQAHNNPGFDIASVTADEKRVVTIEVKGRIEGADEVTITRTEIFTAKNKGGDHRLALVRVSPDGPERDEVRYLVDPFAAEPDPAFDTTRVTKSWRALWERAEEPV